MSILGEHPQKISEKTLNYLMNLIQLDQKGTEMTKLAALSVIQQLMTKDPVDHVRITFLNNGILEQVLMEFDDGMESKENSLNLDLALNILWSLSKLSVCTVQPLITDLVIRRLLSMFDLKSTYYSYSDKCLQQIKDLCENKHLIGHITCRTRTFKDKDALSDHEKLYKNMTSLPTEIYECKLYDTQDSENEINITDHIVSQKLAWPVKPSPESADAERENLEVHSESWKDILVTEVVYGAYFWAHVGIDTVEMVRKIQNFLILEHSSGRLTHRACSKDDIVVVARRKGEELCFFRAQVLKQRDQEVNVWALDYGFVLRVSEDDVYGMPSSLNMPPQIKLCCIQGIQPQPRDPLMVKLAAAVLCNLTSKSLSATRIVEKLEGYELIQRLVKNSPDQVLNKEMYKLIINLSFAEQNRRCWLDTDIIQVLLAKLQEKENKTTAPDILYCLVNLILRLDDARAKFYHSQGIDVVLKLLVINTCNGDIYKACIHLLKAFVQRLNQSSNELPIQKTYGKVLEQPNFSKLVHEEDALLAGEIEYSIPEERLTQDITTDKNSLLGSKEKDMLRDLFKETALPENAVYQSFRSNKTFVLDQSVGIETDSYHELRPNRTLDKVSASVIATHVCGMLNNRKGGEIIFGLSSTSKIVGVRVNRDERDEFRLGVDRMMTDKLSPPVLHSLFDIDYHQILEENLEPVPDLFVIIVRVRPSKGMLYTVKTDNSSYIRFGSSTSALSIQDLRNLVILEEEDRYRSQIIELRHRLQELVAEEVK